jgi:mannose-6-phosphate isomerase-like protein (cupin superfamily)
MQKFDLWLRTVWAFWDTHGTRLLGVISAVYSFIAAVAIAMTGADSKTAAAVMAVGGVFGWATHSRGTNNAPPT